MKFKPTSKSGGMVVEFGSEEFSLPAQPAPAATAVMPEFRLKQILVPVDFSDCSKKALQYAVPLARQFDATLDLLHVLQPITAVPEMPIADLDSPEDAKAELEAVRATLDTSIRFTIMVRRGLPHMEIIRVAKELDVDLVVISTHGHTGLKRVLMGSTAEMVIRHATCPVLVVREHEHEFLADDALE